MSSPRCLVLLSLSFAGCVGGAPPDCFRDTDCPTGQRCGRDGCADEDGDETADALGGDGGGSSPSDASGGRSDGHTLPSDAAGAGGGIGRDHGTMDALGGAAAADTGPADAAEAGALDPERCNGLDDDGDDLIDEDFPVGQACVSGAGACLRAGQTVCGPSGEALCDAPQGEPALELCDGIDNDCDGQIDEAEPERRCYPEGADPATAGHGRCALGTSTCGDIGQPATCVGAVGPTAELCDAVDNDCDDQTDEDFEVGGVCEIRANGCPRTGQIECEPDGLAALCALDAAPPELCNNADEDCDGVVDEGIVEGCYEGPDGTEGVGPCRAGEHTCKDGAYRPCEGQILPASEDTAPDNGVDDDCDGRLDEAVDP